MKPPGVIQLATSRPRVPASSTNFVSGARSEMGFPLPFGVIAWRVSLLRPLGFKFVSFPHLHFPSPFAQHDDEQDSSPKCTAKDSLSEAQSDQSHIVL